MILAHSDLQPGDKEGETGPGERTNLLLYSRGWTVRHVAGGDCRHCATAIDAWWQNEQLMLFDMSYHAYVARMRRSFDAGATWSDVANGQYEDFFSGPAVSHRGRLIVVAGDSNIDSSRDGGSNWHRASYTDRFFGDPSRSLVVNDTVALVSDQKRHIFRTTDGGRQWTEIATPVVLMPFGAANGRVYALDDGARLHYSDESAQRWQPLPTPKDAVDVDHAQLHVSADGGLWLTALHDDDVPAFWHSSDGGRNWTRERVPTEGATYRQQAYHERWLTSDGGHVYAIRQGNPDEVWSRPL